MRTCSLSSPRFFLFSNRLSSSGPPALGSWRGLQHKVCPEAGTRFGGPAFRPLQLRPLGSSDGQRGWPITALLTAFQRLSSLFPMATWNNKLTPFLDKEISRRNLCSITCSVCCISGSSAHRIFYHFYSVCQDIFPRNCWKNGVFPPLFKIYT